MENLIFNAVVTVILCWLVAKWLEHKVHAWAQQELESMQAHQQVMPIGLNLEEIDGVIYGWHWQTNDFVCQGRNLHELRNNFRARYPDRNAAIVGGPADLVTKMKAELKLIHQNENLNSQ